MSQARTRIGDRVFRTASSTSALLMTFMIAAIGIFLVLQAVPALNRNTEGYFGFLTYGQDWVTSDPQR